MEFTKEFPYLKINKGLKGKAEDAYVWWLNMYGRGMNYYSLIKQPAMILVGLKIMVADTRLEDLPYWVFVIFIPVWFAVFPVVGWLDLKFWTWKKEAEWGQRNVNPFEQEMMKKVTEIQTDIKKLKNGKRA